MPRTAILLSLCYLCSLIVLAREAVPAPPATPTATETALGPNTVTWVPSTPGKLLVHLGTGLTDKQMATLNSGFSTFSHLAITSPTLYGDKVLASTACTVKFDMWEEHYEITLLASPPVSRNVKDFHNYTITCLSAEISESAVMEKFKAGQGYLVATLQIEQISASQAEKIRSWLIKQQSVVMRGLFSHMLGEMTLTQTLEIKLQVPPL